MRAWTLGPAALSLLLAACGGGADEAAPAEEAAPAAPAAAPARAHVIGMEAFQYLPRVDTVSVGDTVVWANDDLVAHTAIASDRSWESGDIAPGDSARIVMRVAGTMPYDCDLHPRMTGTLVVQ